VSDRKLRKLKRTHLVCSGVEVHQEPVHSHSAFPHACVLDILFASMQLRLAKGSQWRSQTVVVAGLGLRR
jgi:hypothetical protein